MANQKRVFAYGPETDYDRESGDQFPFWSVWVASDEDGEQVCGTVYTCHSYSKACNLMDKIGADRGLEIVDDMAAHY